MVVLAYRKWIMAYVNLEHYEYTDGGWPWQILGAIYAVATAGKPGEMFFVR